MKKIVSIILVIALVSCGILGYVSYKKYEVKKAVESYLINEKQVKVENIEEMSPFISNLSGDRNWLVYVKIKGDEKKYYYYKNSHNGKVILESYTLNGKEY